MQRREPQSWNYRSPAREWQRLSRLAKTDRAARDFLDWRGWNRRTGFSLDLWKRWRRWNEMLHDRAVWDWLYRVRNGGQEIDPVLRSVMSKARSPLLVGTQCLPFPGALAGLRNVAYKQAHKSYKCAYVIRTGEIRLDRKREVLVRKFALRRKDGMFLSERLAAERCKAKPRS